MTRFLFFTLLFAIIGCEGTPVSTHDNKEELKVDSSNFNSEENVYNVALLVMDGTFNTELTAPMDIFQHTKYRKNIKPMSVFTIANTLDAITTFEGLRILPDYDYTTNYPHIDVLVIPAAEHNLDTDLEDVRLLEFIRKVALDATYVISHCDGAFVLAKTGLLDGRVSTTFPGDLNAYKEMYPNLDVREDVLFVHDGKFITSAGGAKSFEASLYLCEILYGKGVADKLAEGMVINWNLESIDYLVIKPQPGR